MTYPKIETLFNRGDDFAVDTTSLRRPEFGIISRWLVTEKVDGTNIRLIFEGEPSDQGLEHTIKGRSDNAQIDARLFKLLNQLCIDIRPKVGRLMQEYELASFTLFGEGYDEKVQSGGWYREGQGFILFDVLSGGSWLDDAQVTVVAGQLGLERVPLLKPPGLEEHLPDDRLWWTLDEIVHDVRTGLRSQIAQVETDRVMEGIVARPEVRLYDQRGQRVMFKLKTKDFTGGKR